MIIQILWNVSFRGMVFKGNVEVKFYNGLRHFLEIIISWINTRYSRTSLHYIQITSMNYVKLQWNEIKHIQNYVDHVIRWFTITNIMKKRLVKVTYNCFLVMTYQMFLPYVKCSMLHQDESFLFYIIVW